MKNTNQDIILKENIGSNKYIVLYKNNAIGHRYLTMRKTQLLRIDNLVIILFCQIAIIFKI